MANYKTYKTNKNKDKLNKDIRASFIKLIDDEGVVLGNFAIADALELAQERGLDILEVNSNEETVVCKLVDYGKLKYKQSKKQHEAKKKQKQIVIKEIKLRPKIEDHDFNFKKKHAISFLQAGFKVKVSVLFRGREAMHKDLGYKLLVKFGEELKEISTFEQAPKIEERSVTMILIAQK